MWPRYKRRERPIRIAACPDIALLCPPPPARRADARTQSLDHLYRRPGALSSTAPSLPLISTRGTMPHRPAPCRGTVRLSPSQDRPVFMIALSRIKTSAYTPGEPSPSNTLPPSLTKSWIAEFLYVEVLLKTHGTGNNPQNNGRRLASPSRLGYIPAPEL
jgi:hypothetical protein